VILFDRRSVQAFDYLLLFDLVLLLSIGVLLVASASNEGHFQRQIVWATAAIVLALAVSALDYRKLANRAYELWAISMVVLVGLLLFAPVTSGARSWLSIGGVGLQPSELVKIAVILALAHYFAEGDPLPFGARSLFMPALLTLVPFVLVAAQPDLGTASTYLPLLAGIAWVAGIRYGTAARLVAVAAGMAPLGYLLLEDYQRDRLLTFLNPEVDPLGSAYQVVQSKIAVGSGGLLGTGLFAGSQSKGEFLPAQHTDLVFAVLGEELGFLGVALVLTLYLVLLLRVLQTARLARDRAGTYIATGVAALMLYHLLVNVGMVIGFAPITGIPLPLLSYGGSSALTTGIAIGLLMSIRTRRFLN
jgi:rod shape determining protein RodA